MSLPPIALVPTTPPFECSIPKWRWPRGGVKRAVKQGRIWIYVRDDTPFAGNNPPAFAYLFPPDRKGEHPQFHLAGFSGILQADAYSGFGALYRPDYMTGEQPIREVSCWANLRRDFHDQWTLSKSPIALEATNRIGAPHDIERRITGCWPRSTRRSGRPRAGRLPKPSDTSGSARTHLRQE